MSTQYTWQESKRQTNLEKHWLDFYDADRVIDSPYRMDIETIRHGENRQQSFAYVFDLLMVLLYFSLLHFHDKFFALKAFAKYIENSRAFLTGVWFFFLIFKTKLCDLMMIWQELIQKINQQFFAGFFTK